MKKMTVCGLSLGLLLTLAFIPPLHGQVGYWVPADPPKCHYAIDAGIDLEKGLLDGKETVTMKNSTNRLIDVLAFDWSISGSHSIDIPPAQLSKIRYDRNNTVTHSKGFSIVSALDSVLGRETFERIYKKCLKTYGGKHLGWRDLQRFYEKESGRNLDWFFGQWVRSNKYLCYEIESQKSEKDGYVYRSEIKVKRLGSMMMPVPDADQPPVDRAKTQNSLHLEKQIAPFLKSSNLEWFLRSSSHYPNLLSDFFFVTTPLACSSQPILSVGY